MTADPYPNDLPAVLEQLQQADPDLLRSMLTAFVQALMSADADTACGAEYGTRSPDRTNRRNGYRSRDWDTRARTIELAIPKLREGSYFPDWLLERRKRAERALISVVATSYLLGVSTRRMEKLVEQLGITRLSKSQVSIMAKDLDAQVEAFRSRPLDAGPYTFVAADALTMKVREAGRVSNVACLVATGVNADGHREILGLDVCSSESHAGWLTFFRGLTARGLSGVSLVTSDAHPGLVAAIAGALPGAGWQRCRTQPVQICFEWDTSDEQVGAARTAGRKGWLVALRDSAALKVAYAWGLRRREPVMLELADIGTNPKAPEFGTYGVSTSAGANPAVAAPLVAAAC